MKQAVKIGFLGHRGKRMDPTEESVHMEGGKANILPPCGQPSSGKVHFSMPTKAQHDQTLPASPASILTTFNSSSPTYSNTIALNAVP